MNGLVGRKLDKLCFGRTEGVAQQQRRRQASKRAGTEPSKQATARIDGD